MDAETKTALEKSAEEIGQRVLNHVVSLMLLPSPTATTADIVYTGSGALIDTGKKLLLMTCQHVWREFQQYCNDHKGAVVAVGKGGLRQCEIITDLPVVDESKFLDLSILDLSGLTTFEGTEKSFATVPAWPPKRAEIDDWIVAVGFPGKLKKLLPGQVDIQFNALTIIDKVTSVSDRHIILADGEQVRELLWHNPDVANQGVSFGGMSGCPAFVNREMRFDFAGILYEGPSDPEEGNQADHKGMFFFAHADFITADGRVDWSSIPFA